MAEKIAIHLRVNKAIWEELNDILKRKGYPRGVPSWLAQQAFERTILELEYTDGHQLDLFFDRTK